jgi:hypothetical protein
MPRCGGSPVPHGVRISGVQKNVLVRWSSIHGLSTQDRDDKRSRTSATRSSPDTVVSSRWWDIYLLAADRLTPLPDNLKPSMKAESCGKEFLA